MSESLLGFRKFPEKVMAESLADQLMAHGISSEIVEVRNTFDPTFSGNTLQNSFEVKIYSSDFEQAHAALDKTAKLTLGDINSDHYLYEFTNEELFEVLLKPDEWNEADVRLSQLILTKRGENVTESLLDSLRNQRLEDLSKPEGKQTTWIIAGYIFALFGGLLGVFIGWYLWRNRKVLPNGGKVFSYQSGDRDHGLRILIIGVIFIIVWFIIRVQLVEYWDY